MTRRRALVTAGTAALAAAAAVLAVLALGRDGDEEPREAATPVASVPATTAETVAPEPEPEPEPVPTGAELYVATGCGACHGLAGEGTKRGPALGGHEAEQVRRQVRDPLVRMPAYPEEQLAESELDLIAEFVESLAPVEMHVEPVDLPEVVAIHHWLALGALSAGNRDDALHHVGHVIDAVEGGHREAMVRIRALIRRGEVHDAEHALEEMLAGTAEPDLTPAQLNLRLALAAIDRRDPDEAEHQLEHYVARVRGPERESGLRALGLLRGGELHGAEHAVADLLGVARD